MFLGAYHCEGDHADLLAAYDRLLNGLPAGDLLIHVCVAREGGITIYDACPSREVFRAFSSSPHLAAAMDAAGLPRPRVEELGDVHRAFAPAATVR